MTEPFDVRPARKSKPVAMVGMILVGVLLGIGLDRVFLGFAPVLGGKPKLVGKWDGVSSNDPIEFNADGTYAYEIPLMDMTGSDTKQLGGSRIVSQWKWIDGKTIEIAKYRFGRTNVKFGVAITGDTLRLSDEDGSVTEYRRK